MPLPSVPLSHRRQTDAISTSGLDWPKFYSFPIVQATRRWGPRTRTIVETLRNMTSSIMQGFWFPKIAGRRSKQIGRI